MDQLLLATGAPITARRPWLVEWSDCFTSYEPWVVMLRDGERRLRAAALLARRLHHGVVQIVGLGHGPSDYLRLPACDGRAASALAHRVADALQSRRGRPRPWRLRIDQLPRGDPVAAALAERLPTSALAPGDGSPVTRLAPDSCPEEYLSRNFRSHVHRKRRALIERDVAVDVAFHRDRSAVVDLLPELESVRRRRDDQMARVGQLDTGSGRRFYRQLLAVLASRGELEVAVLRLDRGIAAFTVAALDGASYRIWDNRINPDWARWSPGMILEAALFQRLVADPSFTELDRMRGEESYKLRTSNAVVPAEQLWAWSSASVRHLDEAARRTRHWLQGTDVRPLWTGIKRKVLLRPPR